MSIGSNIKNRRLQLGLTQGELAKKCGFSYPSAISKIEKGERDVSSSKLVSIANALNTTPEDLLVASLHDVEDMPEHLKKRIAKMPKDSYVPDDKYIPEVYTLKEIERLTSFNEYLIETLERLVKLYKEGGLSEEEFSQAKKKLLEV